MASLRRMLGKLFGKSEPSIDEIVFERIDPEPEPQSPERAGKLISMEEVLALVPGEWMRHGTWSPQQTIVLPPDTRFPSNSERPSVFSLRALAKVYPQFFRDPGPEKHDPGLDLPMDPLPDPDAQAPALPADVVADTVSSRATFAEWEGEARDSGERAAEAEETARALRGVRLPAQPSSVSGKGFDSVLSQSAGPLAQAPSEPAASVVEAPPSSPRPVEPLEPRRAVLPEKPSDAAPQKPAGNARLRRILEAYAEALPEPEPVPVSETQPDAAEVLLSVESTGARRVEAPVEAPMGIATGASGDSGIVSAVEGSTGELYQMRFEELGLSLSRFSEVRGFALWQGGLAAQTGDLGFDARNAGARMKMERMLESAIQVQGAQDGFSSVTLNHARGGLSVFGGTGCLVAVAHQPEGMPGHLRAWICGWVSQPLRG